ncbi:MAG: S-adenosylmethionine decarboxylase [Aquisalinus sp.]|nr:S-adenosylmethionine decarboxylase [Aquisalinus sp.]
MIDDTNSSQVAIRHHHLIVQCRTKLPIMDTDEAVGWIKKLTKLLDMEILAGPHAVYSDIKGNRGLTASAIITTSHIALHLWDEPDPAEMQLDVYSCKSYRKEVVFHELKSRFNPSTIRFKFIDREHGLDTWNESSL